MSSAGWSDVRDHGVPELRAAWKMAADDPPVEPVGTVDVPAELLAVEHAPAE